ncbi:MAG: pyrroline-5-carboxylate reductase dimerization domain-containing protein [Armatimonadota bacterium]|nr:pyrroline-5-carboxylate reductase dimerization domain-containing protein [Armatimonadota bacterium]
MPNTPSLVGAGMNAWCIAADADDEAEALLREMLDVWGESIEVPESCMNAACALLAVGPTYLFPVIDTLISEAEDAGMATETARRAAAGLFAGVGDLVAQTEATPEELKQMISMQPLDDEAAAAVFREAYQKALAGLRGLEDKLSS